MVMAVIWRNKQVAVREIRGSSDLDDDIGGDQSPKSPKVVKAERSRESGRR